jgi:hypothetical protein
MEKQAIMEAMEKTRADLSEMEISLANAKAERKGLRQAIGAGNTITQVIESYHGFDWADEIGTVESQEIVNKLVRRKSHVNREIGRFKAAIKVMTKNLEIYEVTCENG